MKTLDKYGRIWGNKIGEKCPKCGQPDNCGDCNCKKLSNNEIAELGGTIPDKTPGIYYGIRLIK